MLLVDDNETQPGHRREKSAARAHHYAGRTRADEIPLVIALALAHARMHDCDRIAETPAKTRNRLRSQGYLGDEHDGALAAGEGILDRLQIHLGLARTGNAVDEHDFPASPPLGVPDNLERLRLP